MWVAEGSEQLLTVLTTYDMVFVWTQTRLRASTTDFYRWRRLYGKNLENEPEVPCSQSGEVFSKSHWTNPSRCDMLMHPRRRAQPASPGRARHPDKRALCVGAVTEATRKLTLNGGAGGCPVKAGWSTLKTEHRQKFIWTRRNVNMEKNDIFNTNLLQLPLKAQVADEGVVQDTAPVAEPTAPAMGEGRVLDMLAQDGGVLRRLSNVTPKKCEKLASGFLHRGEITLLCGDGGVGKGQFVAQIAKSLTTGEPTEFFPQAPEGTGNIVILAGEDPIDTVLCPRMDAAGADLNKVAVIAPDTYYEEMHKMPQLGDPDLMNWIAAGDPLLLVIDPFQAFLPDSVNLNNRQQIRNLLQLLRMQAQQHGFAILLVTHTNKNPGACGRKRLNGSGELWDTARNVLIMGHAKNGNKIYVSHEKSSYDAPADTILFTTETVTVRGVETARAKFDSTSDWKDEDFCREKPDRAAPKYAGVQSRILAMLNAAPDKRMVSKELQRLVQEETGCSDSTYNHARSDLSRVGIVKNIRQKTLEGGCCWVTGLEQGAAVA